MPRSTARAQVVRNGSQGWLQQRHVDHLGDFTALQPRYNVEYSKAFRDGLAASLVGTMAGFGGNSCLRGSAFDVALMVRL